MTIILSYNGYLVFLVGEKIKIYNIFYGNFFVYHSFFTYDYKNVP